jgi:hypothetical protein
LRLIAWIHALLGAVAVVAYNPKNCKNLSCLPPTWTREELGKRSAYAEREYGLQTALFTSKIILHSISSKTHKI